MASETTTEKTVNINWGKVAKRDAHGTVDFDATMNFFQEQLTDYVAKNEIDMTEIRAAVEEACNKLTRNGTVERASTDVVGLTTKAYNLLEDVPDGAESKMMKRISDFIRGESKRFEATNGEEGLCHIVVGKNGGANASTPGYVTAYRTKQAEKLKKAAG